MRANWLKHTSAATRNPHVRVCFCVLLVLLIALSLVKLSVKLAQVVSCLWSPSIFYILLTIWLWCDVGLITNTLWFSCKCPRAHWSACSMWLSTFAHKHWVAIRLLWSRVWVGHRDIVLDFTVVFFLRRWCAQTSNLGCIITYQHLLLQPTINFDYELQPLRVAT